MPSNASKYPWDAWFARVADGRPVRIQWGVDFQLPVPEMQRYVLVVAKQRGVVLKTTRQRGGWLRFERRPRPPYPWDVWLGGQQQELRPGIDFHCPVEVMRAQARRAAKTRGQRIRSKLWEGSLWIQALPQDSNALEPA